MKRWILGAILLGEFTTANATIYQCGNSFQNTPCQGAKVINGAPTTTNSQAAARISAFSSGQKKIYAGLQAKQQANDAARAQITAIKLQQLQQEQAQRNATTQEYRRHILRAPLNPINDGPTTGEGRP
ncbi:MAG: hypothetical protein ACYCYL_05925 [Acidithiobacillus sp.]